MKLMAEIIKFNGNVKKATEQMEEVPEDWGEFVGALNEKATEKESSRKTEIYKVH